MKITIENKAYNNNNILFFIQSVYYAGYESVVVGEELADKVSAHGLLHNRYNNQIKEYIKKGLRISKRQQGRLNIEVPECKSIILGKIIALQIFSLTLFILLYLLRYKTNFQSSKIFM